jgi:hypothetical protein
MKDNYRGCRWEYLFHVKQKNFMFYCMFQSKTFKKQYSRHLKAKPCPGFGFDLCPGFVFVRVSNGWTVLLYTYMYIHVYIHIYIQRSSLSRPSCFYHWKHGHKLCLKSKTSGFRMYTVQSGADIRTNPVIELAF